MIFLGYNFASDRYALSPVAVNVPATEVVLQNGVYDDFHATSDVETAYSLVIPSWDFSTIMYAEFKEDLFAGNVSYNAEQVSSMIVKRRKVGEYDWQVIENVVIESEDDFYFKRIDRYARGNSTEYEYAVVPILNGIEGNYNTNTVISDFEGIFIMDAEQTFHTPLDIEIETQQQKPTSAVATIGRRYPYVVANGLNNYVTGTVSAKFIDQDDDDHFLLKDGVSYRKRLNDFLLDGGVKILKYQDGRMWLISIMESVGESVDGHEQNVTSNFSFTEIGDADSSDDLNDNGLLDIPADLR